MRISICLNGEWDFMPLNENGSSFDLPTGLGYDDRKIQVPSSWRASYVRPSGKSFVEIPEHRYAPMICTVIQGIGHGPMRASYIGSYFNKIFKTRTGQYRQQQAADKLYSQASQSE